MQLKNVNAVIGSQVATLRKRRGMSQAELAVEFGRAIGKTIDPTLITRLEAGRRPVSVVDALALCEIFDVAMDSLLESDRAIPKLAGYWSSLAESLADKSAELESDRKLLQARLNDVMVLSDCLNTLLRYQRHEIVPDLLEALFRAAMIGQRPGTQIEFQAVLADMGISEALERDAIEYAKSRGDSEPSRISGHGVGRQTRWKFWGHFCEYLIDNLTQVPDGAAS